MEWETVIVAGLGIGGTLSAAALSPFATAKLARRERRLEIYAETLALLWVVKDSARTLSSIPAAANDDLPRDRLRHLDAQARLVAGRAVREQLQIVIDLANRFDRELFIPQLHHRRLRHDQNENPDAPVDTPLAIQERMALGAIADELSTAITVLENAMRAEVS